MAVITCHEAPVVENDETTSCWGTAEFLPRLCQLGFIGTGSATPALLWEKTIAWRIKNRSGITVHLDKEAFANCVIWSRMSWAQKKLWHHERACKVATFTFGQKLSVVWARCVTPDNTPKIDLSTKTSFFFRLAFPNFLGSLPGRQSPALFLWVGVWSWFQDSLSHVYLWAFRWRPPRGPTWHATWPQRSKGHCRAGGGTFCWQRLGWAGQVAHGRRPEKCLGVFF